MNIDKLYRYAYFFDKKAGLLKYPEKLLNDMFGWVAYEFAQKTLKNLDEEYFTKVPEWTKTFFDSKAVFAVTYSASEDIVSSLGEHGDNINVEIKDEEIPRKLQFKFTCSRKLNPNVKKEKNEYGYIPYNEYDYLYSASLNSFDGNLSAKDIGYDELYKLIYEPLQKLNDRIAEYEFKYKLLKDKQEYFEEDSVEAVRLRELCKSIPKNTTPLSQRDSKAMWGAQDYFEDAMRLGITVQIFFDKNSGIEHYNGEPWRGLYEHYSTLISLIAVPDCNNVKEFKEKLLQLRTTLRHELQHFMQFSGNSISTKKMPKITGLPGKKIRQPGVDVDGISTNENKPASTPIEHALRDVEFYTRLSDEADRFKQKYDNLPEDVRKQVAKIIVGLGAVDINVKRHAVFKEVNEPVHFFAGLKEHAPEKWKKAVKEFFKAIDI